jgi:hypothetical protein
MPTLLGDVQSARKRRQGAGHCLTGASGAHDGAMMGTKTAM